MPVPEANTSQTKSTKPSTEAFDKAVRGGLDSLERCQMPVSDASARANKMPVPDASARSPYTSKSNQSLDIPYSKPPIKPYTVGTHITLKQLLTYPKERPHKEQVHEDT